jgi:hypothetical protein
MVLRLAVWSARCVRGIVPVSFGGGARSFYFCTFHGNKQRFDQFA